MFAGSRRVGASALVALLCALGSGGCGSDAGSDPDPPVAPGPPPAVPPPPPPPPPPPTNRAPTASAGADLIGTTGRVVTLNAAGSTDPDGDTLRFSWFVIAGPAGGAVLGDADQVTASLQTANAGTYLVQVTVTDPSNATASDVLSVTVNPPRSASGLTLEGMPAQIAEGKAATVAVYLPAPAGANGAEVTVASSDPAIVAVPQTLSVPAGETVAAFSADALAIGSATITVTAPGMDSANVATSVSALALDLDAAPRDGVVVGQASTITVTLRAPAPAGGAHVALTLTNPARATLSASQIDIAAGASTATATLTGAQPGAVDVTATLAGSAPAQLHFLVIPAGASATSSSAALIDAALTNGTLTTEQATLYGVYAALGAAELPAAYRGNDIGKLDGAAGRLVNLRFDTLSVASQEAIGKYLFPPIYSGSWGAGITPTAQKASGPQPLRAADVSCFERLRGMPRSDTLPHWRSIVTRSFRIWYPVVLNSELAGFNWYTVEQNAAAALTVEASIQEDFDRLSATLGEPLRDGGVVCNGGDDRIDVYVTRVGLGAKAQVMPYLPGECARPGWMWVAPDALRDPIQARNLIAHELVHLFQLRYARPNCDDWRYGILDEQTASWAFDHLYRGDNYEHRFLTGDGAYFGASAVEWLASPLEIAAGATAGRHCNGYCDYLFMQWLDRKYGATAIRSILDATVSVNAQQAYESGLSGVGGGLQQLWPRFALFQWNDFQEHVQDELHGWSSQSAASIKNSFAEARPFEIVASLNGQRTRDLGEAIFDKLRTIRDGELPPMTTMYLTIRFSDENVTRVNFEHLATRLHARWPRLKVQALQKIHGDWRAVEDWTGEETKNYCRDKADERIEKLILVFSNSHAGDQPFLHEGPTVVQLYEQDGVMPTLKISSGACMPWHGRTTVKQTAAHGSVATFTANVQFKLVVLEGEDPDEVAQQPIQMFVPESGIATAESNWVDAIGCRQTVVTTPGSIGELDGQLTINFDQGRANGGGVTPLQGTLTLQCPGADPIVASGPYASQWFNLGALGQELSVDGRSLRGSFTETDSMTGVTTTSTWDLSAEREP